MSLKHMHLLFQKRCLRDNNSQLDKNYQRNLWFQLDRKSLLGIVCKNFALDFPDMFQQRTVQQCLNRQHTCFQQDRL
jgi:hypothetical protein